MLRDTDPPDATGSALKRRVAMGLNDAPETVETDDIDLEEFMVDDDIGAGRTDE